MKTSWQEEIDKIIEEIKIIIAKEIMDMLDDYGNVTYTDMLKKAIKEKYNVEDK